MAIIKKICIKKSFHTEKNALKVLEKINGKKEKHEKQLKQVYLCKDCGKYHLTSWTKKKFNRAIPFIELHKLEREAMFFIKRKNWKDIIL